MIRRKPIIRQLLLTLKNNIHVIQHRHISIEITNSIILEESKHAQLRPRISEALSYERHLDVLGWQKMVALAQDHVAFWSLQLENPAGILGQVGRVEDDE